MNREVVITGAGVVTPIGDSLEALWAANLSGQSGLKREAGMDLSGLPCGWISGIIGEDVRASVKDKWVTPSRPWGDALLNAAIDQAVTDAGIVGPLARPAGLFWVKSCPATGCSPEEYEEQAQATVRRFEAAGEDFASVVACLRQQASHSQEELSRIPQDVCERLEGPVLATRIEATCSGGLRAVAEGARLLRSGRADVAVIAGAVSRRSQYVLSQYAQLMALSRWNGEAHQASMPFDRRRSGMVMSESSAAIVLETAEHAQRRGVSRSYASISGWALAVDTAHVTAPRVEMVERVVRDAIGAAGLQCSAIDVVNAHGTSTKLNDVTEARALHSVMGSRMSEVDVCAVKSLTGHASAASGIVEIIVSGLTLCEDVVPPVVTCTEPDPDCNVKINLRPLERPVRTILKNSFGFGGQYASMVLRKPQSPRKQPTVAT